MALKNSPLLRIAITYLAAMTSGAHAVSAASSILQAKGWAGTFTVRGKLSGENTFLGANERWEILHEVTGTATFSQWEVWRNGWSGSLSGQAKVEDHYVLQGGGDTMKTDISGAPTFSKPGYLSVSLDGKSYTFYPNTLDVPAAATNGVFSGIKNMIVFPTMNNEAIPIPDGATELSGTRKVKGVFHGETYTTNLTELEYEVTWSFRPLGVSDLEVVIEPQSYQTWRPEAGPDEETPGNTITVKARLQKKDGSSPNVQARYFRWKLNGTSKAPGVAMNWPKWDVAGQSYDLKFMPETNAGMRSFDANQQAETPPGLYSESRAVVTSFDWGAWSTLQVVAELPDGTQITGHLAGATEDDARLPKRRPDSKIADVWRERTGAQGDDLSDDDVQPIGDGHLGDGLTLYEEYRGFIENGKHIEGDPKRKDYFMRDEIGAASLAGRVMFRNISKLNVHDRFLPDELSGPNPKINANAVDGLHVTDQHGIIMRYDYNLHGFCQAVPLATEPNEPSTPRRYDHIGIDTNLSNWKSEPAAVFAHEMLHTVSVWHHGEIDSRGDVTVYLPPPGSTQPPLMSLGEPEDAFRALKESGEAYDDLIKLARKNYAEHPEGWTLHKGYLMAQYSQWLGRPGGQHSGNDQCVMAYRAAQMYANTAVDALYFGFENPQTSQVCTSRAGTGVNASDRQPQSRFGDASPSRGDCVHQICVNDRHNHPVR